jgi:hypothetical protein
MEGYYGVLLVLLCEEKIVTQLHIIRDMEWE